MLPIRKLAAIMLLKADHRADRKVDPARHDHQRHADRNHRVDRGLQQDVDQIGRLVEAAGQNRKDENSATPPNSDAGLSKEVSI